MSKLDLIIMKAGYCDAFEHHAIRGGKRRKITFDAVFAIIRHPRKGIVLFDTGYTRRFYKETKNYPNRLYAKITKVFIKEEEEAVQQLKTIGIKPEEVKHIIVSHFHADHIGGLKDFPSATFYCSTDAYNQVLTRNGFSAFRKGLLKGLVPDDFESKVILIEKCKKVFHPLLGIVYDLFGDGLVLLVDLKGHGAGQIGALLLTKEKTVFLVADACWLSLSYKKQILPNSIVRLFFDSWKDYKKNLSKLHEFYKAHPEILIVPTHCNATTSEIMSKQKIW